MEELEARTNDLLSRYRPGNYEDIIEALELILEAFKEVHNILDKIEADLAKKHGRVTERH